MREFLHVDDMAAASVFVMNLSGSTYSENTSAMLSHINVGTGIDCTIKELSETIAKVVGFKGKVLFDSTKPDGTARKLMNVDRLNGMGWVASITLADGLLNTYQWFLNNQSNLRN